MLVKVLQETFIPPSKFAEGSIIEYIGPWGPQFEPLDDAARAAEAEYAQRRPGATLDPTKDLSITVGEGKDQPQRGEYVVPRASIVRAPTDVGTDAQSSGNPGLAMESGDPAAFGKRLLEQIENNPAFAEALAKAIAEKQSVSGTAVVTPDLEPSGDMPGRGAGAETVSQEEAADAATRRAASAPDASAPDTPANAAVEEANVESAKAGGAKTETKVSLGKKS